jgi:hypothetical protein
VYPTQIPASPPHAERIIDENDMLLMPQKVGMYPPIIDPMVIQRKINFFLF